MRKVIRLVEVIRSLSKVICQRASEVQTENFNQRNTDDRENCNEIRLKKKLKVKIDKYNKLIKHKHNFGTKVESGRLTNAHCTIIISIAEESHLLSTNCTSDVTEERTIQSINEQINDGAAIRRR